MERLLSAAFMEDLQSGILHNLLERVRSDDTLMLAIRKGYINIYYRGGNILRLEEKPSRIYNAHFDVNYGLGDSKQLPPSQVASSNDIETWIEYFPILKHTMDSWFSRNPKMEREFQQLVVRENNSSPVSNETEYFMVDIELADSSLGARFDMMAIKWPAKARKSGEVRLALIEMKYGDGALTGKSGIAEHLQQLQNCLCDLEKRKKLCAMAEGQINQLNQLGLLRHKKGAEREFFVDGSSIEAIFLFANHNPRSPKLLDELKSLEGVFRSIEEQNIFMPRFFVASTAGYAMHDICMVGIDDYLALLGKQPQEP